MEKTQKTTSLPNQPKDSKSAKESPKEEIKEEKITIKIQTMDSSFLVSLLNTSTILSLKQQIATLYKIPVESQRLIYQGKLMVDTDTLVHLKITNDCVVHLVARALEEQNPQPEQANQEPPVEEFIPVVHPFRTNRRRGRIILPHFDMSECFETLYQNIIAIENLNKCKTSFKKDNTSRGANMEAFDFLQSKYEVGEWVDVKDTIEQWLEAQVLKVENNKAFVHYNGWGPRWDEWIDFSSPRMRNFKVYTVQSPSSVFMSPYPGIPCDSNIEPQERSIDSFFYLTKAREQLNELLKDMDTMIELRNEQKKMFDKGYLNEKDREILFKATQIIPFMDRCGRLLSDLSMQFSHLVINPNLYPQMLLGHKRDDVFSELKEIANKKKHKKDDLPKFESLNMSLDNTSQPNTNIPFRRHNTSDNIINSAPQNNFHFSNRNRFHSLSRPSSPTIQNNLGYNLSTSSFELPFIQRIHSSFTQGDRIIGQSSQINQIITNEASFPKMNLQTPSLLSPGEVMLLTGYQPYSQSNFEVFVHATNQVVQQPRPALQDNQQQTQIQINSNNTITSSNEGNLNQTNQSSTHRLNEVLGLNETNNQTGTNTIISNENSNPFNVEGQLYKDEYTQTETEEKK